MTEEQFMPSLEAAVRGGSVPPMKLWWEILRQNSEKRWSPLDELRARRDAGSSPLDEFEPADAR